MSRWHFTATASSTKGRGTRSKEAGRGRAQCNSARDLHPGLVLDDAVETLVDLGEAGAGDRQSRVGLDASHDYRKFVPTLINTHGFED